jgi:bifunctional oligoribonuclease and PAP phosphatase NrnA
MQYQHLHSQILETIKTATFPLLVSHEKPDGDTLGAGLALAQYLNKENINYKHFCPEPIPEYFSNLPGVENIINNIEEIILGNHDLIIALDCGTLARTGLEKKLSNQKDSPKIINIDHHQTNLNYGYLNLVIPTASSTSEIMFNFFTGNKIMIDKYMATDLLTGILTDTMNFTNSATTKESLGIASDLLTRGARLNQIISSLSQNKTMMTLKLWGKVFSQLQHNESYNFAYAIIPNDDLKEHQMSADDASDGLANFLSSMQDVNFILVLTEQDDALIKGSLRTTRNEVDVSRLAAIFGGGGHKKASGFKVKKDIIGQDPDWKNFILNAIINELRTANP